MIGNAVTWVADGEKQAADETDTYRNGGKMIHDDRVMMDAVETIGGMAATGWKIHGSGSGNGYDGIVAVAHVGGEEIRCTLKPQEGRWASRIETEEVALDGFLIAGHVMTPEVAARHVADARNGAA